MTYTSIDDMDVNERYSLATDLALAAICGEGVYNLGEVIATPILSCLVDSPNSWLQDIIMALYKGDISAFNAVIEANSEKYYSQPALAGNHESIKRKAVLLCVLNIAFNRNPHNRDIEFVDISTKASIPLEYLEWALMRAFSIGIIRGTIDQVNQRVSITWVQPRTLDQVHLNGVTSAVQLWSERYYTQLK